MFITSLSELTTVSQVNKCVCEYLTSLYQLKPGQDTQTGELPVRCSSDNIVKCLATASLSEKIITSGSFALKVNMF